MLKLGIQGKFHIKHTRDGQVVTEFDTYNSITKRGAIHMFHTMCSMSGITALQGNRLNDFIGIFSAGLQLLTTAQLTGPFSRDDAIEYRDNGGTLVQGDNRAWNGATPTSSSSPPIWDPVVVKNDSSASWSVKVIPSSSRTYGGVWLSYVRDRNQPFACSAVLSSALFPAPVVMKADDELTITYTLSFNSTPAIP